MCFKAGSKARPFCFSRTSFTTRRPSASLQGEPHEYCVARRFFCKPVGLGASGQKPKEPDHMDQPLDSSQTRFWTNRWEAGKTPWDLGGIPPALAAFLARREP